jgi:membrane fusion protein (multidrug efflux system)
MARRNILPLLVLLLIAGGVGWWFYHRAHPAQQSGQAMIPPTVVSTATAKEEAWRDRIEVVGSLRAVQGVDVTTELAGLVSAIHFNSGGDAKAGDVLVELDTSADRAQLAGYQAQVEWTTAQLARNQKLVRTQAASRATLDQVEAQNKQALANVAYQQAIIAKKTIRAPFSGRLGIRLVDLGQYLSPGTPIVTLQALDPIRAEFTLPQQDLDRIAVGAPVEVRADTYPGKVFAGRLTAINPRADVKTRNFAVEATFDNPDRLLHPGMFVKVAVLLPGTQQIVTLPQTAINFSPYGDSVFVIAQAKHEAAPAGSAAAAESPALAARQRFVKLGDTRGDQNAVVDGVKDGEVVATSGQFKLQDGAPVIVNNQIQPENNPAPRPGNS